MKLEQQVVSLELAQKLKSLGVKQESLFSWETYVIKEHNVEPYKIKYHNGNTERIKPEYATNLQFISAFTVAELGILPSSVVVGEVTVYLTITKKLDWWIVRYEVDGSIYFEVKNLNEADARAKMLIYLLENKLK